MEFALCALLFLGVVLGIMEFGRLVYSYTVLAGATREASRYAMVHGSRSGSPATEEDILAELKRWAIGLDRDAISVDATWTPSNAPGSLVRVQSSYTVSPFVKLIIPSSITIGSRSELVISQ